MKFYTISKTDPERVFIMVQNNEGSALGRGDVVEWDSVADTATAPAAAGKSVEKADASKANEVCGVVEGISLHSLADIPTADYGFVQVYGYHSAVKTDGNIAAHGDALVTTATGVAGIGAAADAPQCVFGVALEGDGATTLCKAIIRAM